MTVIVTGNRATLDLESPFVRWRIHFDSAEALKTWAQDQLRTWASESDLARAAATETGIEIRNTLFDVEQLVFHDLVEAAQSASIGQPSWVNAPIKGCLQSLSDLAERGQILIDGTNMADRVRSLREIDKEAFAVAALFGSQQSDSVFRTRTMAGGNGLSLRAVAKAATARFSPPIVVDDQVGADLREQLAAWKAEYNELGAHGERLANLQEAATAAIATLHEQLKLHKPVKYWTDRADSLKWITWLAGIAFVTLVAVYGAFAWFEIKPMVEGMKNTAASDGRPLLLEIALLTLPSLAFFWVLRIFARLFNHGLSRGADARERATLINAYLALCEVTATTPSESERLILMRAISRPGPGDNLDEVAPDTILDQLLNAAKGK